jgi:ketosteroid isomerase-like protein
MMAEESKHNDARPTMLRINRAWLDGHFDDLAPMLHPEVVMVFPGFAGRVQGREQFLDGFRDFRENARIHEFHEHDHQVDIAGDIAVITFRYEMVYQRSGERYRSTGRDLWIFQHQNKAWIAVWRTMLDMEENPVK